MTTRIPLTDEFIAEIAEFDERAEDAVDAGDAAALAENVEEIWNRMPTPRVEHDLQALVSWCTNAVEDLGDWPTLRTWLPRYAEQYGEDDPSTRIIEGVLLFNTGEEQRAREILRGVLDEFGPTVFEGRREYLKIAGAAR